MPYYDTKAAGDDILFSDWNALVDALGAGGSGNIVNTVSFIIYNDGTDTFARNGSTGVIDYGGSSDAGGVDGADAHAVFDAVVTIFETTGGFALVKRGTYDFGANILEMTYPTGQSHNFGFFGEGGWNTIITGTGTKMIDVTNTEIPLGGYTWLFFLEQMRFEHDCSNASDVTLDLACCQPVMSHIQCRNTNGTRNGTAFRGGCGAARVNSGYPMQWNSLSSLDYDVGFEVGLEQLSLYDCNAMASDLYGFKIHDLLDGRWIERMALFHPRVSGVNATVMPYWFEGVGQDINLHSPSIEGPSYTNELFTMAAARVTTHRVGVSNACFHPTGNTLSNDPARFIFNTGCRSAQKPTLGHIGLYANPFFQADEEIRPTGSGADSTRPDASTDYLVCADCFITSSDSGGADCAILIKDAVGGNTIKGALSTLAAEYVTAGMCVNWGAYTGAVPTVSVWFV